MVVVSCWSQGVEGNGAKDALELRGQQRLKNLTTAVIIQRGSGQAILEPGEPPALLQAFPHLLESMLAIEKSEEQGLSTPRPYDRTWAGCAG